MSLKIDKMVVGPLMTNCYIVSSGQECVVIDPGFSGEEIAQFIREKEYTMKRIFASHGHFDHVSGVRKLKESVKCDFSIGHNDVDMYMDTPQMARRFAGVEVDVPLKPDSIIEEGSADFGDSRITFIYTPGHTMGSYSFLIEDHLFTGDTLFKGSIGRMDYGGSEEYMIKTIEQLKKMEDGIMIHPGHGPESTIREEKENNPFLNGSFMI